MAFSRTIKCKQCRFKGVVEAHDTEDYPPEKIFKHLGKDPEGYLHFQCPSCGADEAYSPYQFFNPVAKLGCLVIIVIIIWVLIKMFS